MARHQKQHQERGAGPQRPATELIVQVDATAVGGVKRVLSPSAVRLDLQEACFLVEMRRLREAGIRPQQARPAIDGWLRARAAGDERSRLVIEGKKVRLVTGETAWEAGSGQGLLSFLDSAALPMTGFSAARREESESGVEQGQQGVEPKPVAGAPAQSLQPSGRTLAFRRPDRAGLSEMRTVQDGGSRDGLLDGLFDQAVAAEDNEPKHAMELYRRLLGEDPGQVDAHVNLGRLLHDCGALVEAETCYRAALECLPRAMAAFNLGVVLEDQGREREAREAYEGALGLDPEHADAWFNLSRLFEAVGDRAGALRCLSRYRGLLGR